MESCRCATRTLSTKRTTTARTTQLLPIHYVRSELMTKFRVEVTLKGNLDPVKLKQAQPHQEQYQQGAEGLNYGGW